MNKWQITRLDQCARIVGGSTPKTSVKDYWDGEIYWATPKDLSNLESPNLEGTPRKITKAGLDSCGAEVLPEGSVLFSSRAPIGHVAINCVPMATNQGFKSFVPDPEKLDAKFLYYWLRKNRTFFNSLGNGATFKEVSKAIVSRIEIPLPPIAQQKRIAAILDKAEELRSLRRQALGALDAIAQSIFLEMFGDPTTNPKSWIRVRFSDLLSAIESGRSPNCLDRPVEDEEWGVLKLGAVTWCEYNPLENKALPSNEKPDLSLEVKPGDLLFTRKNTFELVAACALVRSTPPHLLLPDLIFRFRTKPNAPIDLCFLHQLLINPAKRREIQKLASGSASSMPNISKTKLETVLIEVPPLSLQQEFARRVEAIEQLKTTHRQSLTQLDALFASLQHRAFRGEL